MSDHYPIVLIRKKERLSHERTEVKCRSFKNFNLENFRNDLAKFKFEDIYAKDVNTTWSAMWTHIVKICEIHCPYVVFSAKSKLPFIDDDLLKKMKERDKAFARARQTKLATDMTYAKNLRQAITRDLRKARKKFILEQIELSNGNSKKFWEIINKIFFSTQKPVMTQIVDPADGNVLEGLQASEFINNYFCSISQSLANKFGPMNRDLIIDCDELENGNSWVNSIDLADVVKQILDMTLLKHLALLR